MDELRGFYLQNRNVVIVSPDTGGANHSVVETSANLERAFSLCLRIAGINPRRLAQFPVEMEALETLVNNKYPIATLVDQLNFTSLHGSPVARGFFAPSNQVTSQTLSDFLDELVKNSKSATGQDQKNLVLTRVVAMLQEIEECCICMLKSAETFFQCGHRVCESCSVRISKCPLCREHILQRIQLAEPKSVDEVDPKSVPELKKGAPLPLNVKRPKFSLVTDATKFYQQRIKGLISGKSSLSNVSETEISHLAKFGSLELFQAIKNSHVHSEETISFVVASLFNFNVIKDNLVHVNWSADELSWASKLAPFITSPTRMIRFLAALSKREPDANAKNVFIGQSFSNPLRKWIVKTLDEMKSERAIIEMKKRPGFWKFLFRHIHVREKRFQSFTRAQELANIIRGNQKTDVVSSLAKMNNLIKTRDMEIFQFFEKEPGLFMRNFCHVLSKFKDTPSISEDELVNAVLPVLKKMPQIKLIELSNIIDGRIKQVSEENRVFKLKNGKIRWQDIKKYPIPADFLNLFAVEIENELECRECTLEPDCDLVIDMVSNAPNCHINRGKSPKVPSWVSTALTAGDVVEIDPQAEIILFIYWMNKDTRVDLDLSVIMVNEQLERCEFVDYTNLEDSTGTVVHSGDLTDASPPHGAAEYIRFVPSKYRSASDRNVKNILMACFSFNRVSFEDMGAAICGVGVIDEGKAGLGPGGSHVIAACEMRGSAQICLPGYLEFKNDGKCEFVFMNAPLASRTSRTRSVRSSDISCISLFKNFKHWKKTRISPSFDFVATKLLLNAKSVIKIAETNSVFEYKKETDESGKDFRKRLLETDGEPLKSLKGRKLVHFGEEFPSNLEMTENSDSIRVSKTDTGTMMVWTSDPYSVIK